MYPNMNLTQTIHRLFLLVTLLAIVVGPMSIGLASSAMASSGSALMDGMTNAMPEMDMAAMPCHPEKQPLKLDCGKGCPVALICTTAIFAQVPSDQSWSVRAYWLSHRFDMMPHAQLASTLIDPPVRPPKA